MIKKGVKSVRLPKYITPTRYKIWLAPDLDNFTFEGEEEIEIELRRETNKIILHSAELEILSVELLQGRKSQTGKVSYNEKDETVALVFDSKIPEGKVLLKIKFEGILNDKLRGFYRSRYEFGDKTYHMGITQFESTDARRAIPCFDEPAQKAIFEVSLKIPSDRTAISNTIETEVLEHEGGFKTLKFSPSPKMSSYLLAFIVGHFEHIEKKSKSGVTVRVFVTPGKRHQARFALDVASRCIDFYEDYFGIKYPLPVMDLIAIPDFAAGAMENWGAVTYRETAILVDPEHSSTQNKQWVALVIAHELAHQWFGNLVTMEWWTHLWLNEGFASYMEYVAIDKLFPKWNIWSQFVFIEHARGLLLDGLSNTHSIEVDVTNPAEISEIFDAVSYSKGASVIRMLAEYLGEKSFRLGLKNYLRKHSYANATTNDLWKALGKASGKPVRKIMENWTRKPGYPLISVKSNKGKLEISQSRFFSSPRISPDDKKKWLVPLSIAAKDRRPQSFLLRKDKDLISGFDGWVKMNTGETSFARVIYDRHLLNLLRKPIVSRQIAQEDRFGVARDIFTLAEAGKISTTQALKFAASFKKENEYIVWAQLASHLLKLSSLLYEKKYYPLFNKYIIKLFKGILRQIGWEKRVGESHSRTLLRSVIIYIVGTSGDPSVIQKAKKLFADIQNGFKADPDLTGVVYRLVAENGGQTEYEQLMNMYRKTQLAEEKDRILRALCSFKQKELLERTFDFAFSSEARAQDLVKTFVFIFASSPGRKIAWKTLKAKWDEIKKRFEGGHLFSRFVSPLDNLLTEQDAREVELFFKKNSAPGIKRTVAQVVEQIRSNAAWLERDSMQIDKFLRG